MKKNTSYIICTLILLCFFVSCKSKEITEKPEIERTQEFIADINPIFLDTVNLYTKNSVNNPYIAEYNLYFSPRTNSVFINVTIGITSIRIVFSYSERNALYESVKKYLYNYENNLIIQEKPTSKNAYYKGTASIDWGVLALNYSTDTKYQTNVEYLWIDKPYYRLRFEATDDKDKDASSPAFSVYISPTQWQTLFDLCNQQALEARCDEILAEADAF